MHCVIHSIAIYNTVPTLGLFYWMLLNVHPAYRSSIHFTQLPAVALNRFEQERLTIRHAVVPWHRQLPPLYQPLLQKQQPKQVVPVSWTIDYKDVPLVQRSKEVKHPSDTTYPAFGEVTHIFNQNNSKLLLVSKYEAEEFSHHYSAYKVSKTGDYYWGERSEPRM